jgi:hypothetical protein
MFLRSGVADDTRAAWMAISVRRLEATICVLSALALHDLTDDIPTRTEIAIPRGYAAGADLSCSGRVASF